MPNLIVSEAVDTLMQATNQAGIRTAAGLGNVDNTSDANKPVSSAVQAALDQRQPLDSDLTAIAALSTTAFGRALLTAATRIDVAAFPIVTESTTARTLGLADAQTYIRTTNAAAVNITVPPQASVAWVASTEIIIFVAGTGQVTLVAGAGVTINTPESLKSAKRFSTLTLKRVAADVWDLSGNLEAA